MTSPDRWLSTIHPEDRPRLLAAFGRISGGYSAREEAEYRIVLPDGTIRWVRDSVRAIPRDGAGRLLHGVVSDITERARAEGALRTLQTELARMTRVMTMGEMAASIAHEINQPLAAVVANGGACLRWLAADPPNLEEAREAVTRIVGEGNRASEVIARVRAFLGRSAPAKTRLDVNEIIGEVLALVHAEVGRHGAAVRTALAAGLPPVLADRVALQQVLLNLIVNGLEAVSVVPSRPREVVISTQGHEPRGVLIAVRDSGIGLDPETAGRIFEAFFTTKPGGLGMGLTISRAIIEAHGGRVWAAANADGGATVRFTLPAVGEGEA
jgi:C4-dicarboxylate-specific signal transduction histidine kinase